MLKYSMEFVDETLKHTHILATYQFPQEIMGNFPLNNLKANVLGTCCMQQQQQQKQFLPRRKQTEQ